MNNLSIMQRLRSDQHGATVVEFAFVAPVLLVMMLGTMDIARTQYLRTVIEGELQHAARESSMEGGQSAANLSAMDDRVRAQMKNVSKTSSITFDRRAYMNNKMAEQRKEDFTDANGNGKCDAGEPFVDANNNSSWDFDSGMSGQGKAEQSVVYTATATVPRVFPMHGLLGWNKNIEIKASTILKNQPYDGQIKATSGNCA